MKPFFIFFLCICLGGASIKLYPHVAYKNGYPVLKDQHLVAYVVAREEVGEALMSSFCKKTGCTYEFIRLSTEEMLRRVEEEKKNPKTDVVIGGPVDAHQVLKNKHLSISVELDDKVKQYVYKDKDDYWYGYEMEQLSIGINTERWEQEIAPLGVELPKDWEDLLNPYFRGKIVMPDPNTSGTAHTFLQSIVANMGKKGAIQYLKRFHSQIGQYTPNGYTPAEYVASGEYLIGINFRGDQKMLNIKKFPILSIVPRQTTFSINSISKLQDAPHGQVGDLFLRYCLSEEGKKIIEKVSYGTLTIKENKGTRVSIKTGHKVDDYSVVLDYWNKLRFD
ncbi:ABC transporter substrate-binding protein [Bacillus changyiensis]|uniref:ABC transporter substrate-binding protein n=1 Tax=Bacillus changyiensis TaxID=3004103 RepID=UPI0039774222